MHRVRPALPDEIDGPFEFGWVLEEGDAVTGHVAVTMLTADAPWIHDLRCWSSDSFGLVALLSRARKQVWDMGHAECYVSVECTAVESPDSIDRLASALDELGFGPMLKPLLGYGLRPVQIILKGKV